MIAPLQAVRGFLKRVVPSRVVRMVRAFVNHVPSDSKSDPWALILGDDGLFHWEDLTLDLRRNTITLFIRDEILNGGEYAFSTPRPCVVIDIGMNIGDTPLYFARMPHVAKVYAYEPIRDTYEWAMANLRLNPRYAEKIVAVNAGVSDSSEPRTCSMNFQAGTGGAAIEIVNSDHLQAIENASYILDRRGEGTHTYIEMRNIVDEISAVRSQHPTEMLVLKCDAEGAEWRIVPALERNGCLQHISVIMLEYHYRRPDELLETLTRNGFSCFLRDLKQVKHAEVGNIYAVRTIG